MSLTDFFEVPPNQAYKNTRFEKKKLKNLVGAQLQNFIVKTV